MGAEREASAALGVNPAGQSDNSAPGAGAAYVFERTGVTWSQQAYLKASNANSNDSFGSAVDLSGSTLAVGAPTEDSFGSGVNPAKQFDNTGGDSGATYVFRKSGSSWIQEAYLKPGPGC